MRAFVLGVALVFVFGSAAPSLAVTGIMFGLRDGVIAIPDPVTMEIEAYIGGEWHALPFQSTVGAVHWYEDLSLVYTAEDVVWFSVNGATVFIGDQWTTLVGGLTGPEPYPAAYFESVSAFKGYRMSAAHTGTARVTFKTGAGFPLPAWLVPVGASSGSVKGYLLVIGLGVWVLVSGALFAFFLRGSMRHKP